MISWNRRRQIRYFLIVVIFIASVAGSFYWYTKPAPSCFDGKLNQNERGVDCGGSCLKVCSADVIPLQTVWIRPFEIIPGSYSVIGLFENHNRDLGVDRLAYTIRLVNDLGATIATRSGETFVNPQEKFVIFESALPTGGQKPVRAFIEFNSNVSWATPKIDRPILTVVRKEISNDDKPLLHAVVTNTSVYDLESIVVPVVLSGNDNNVFTGSATLVESLPRGASKDMYFTWPNAWPYLPAITDFYPRVNTFRIEA